MEGFDDRVALICGCTTTLHTDVLYLVFPMFAYPGGNTLTPALGEKERRR